MSLLIFAMKAMLIIASFCSGFEFVSHDHLKVIVGNKDHEWSLFENFREKFDKAYDNLDEMRDRFNIFRNNLKIIVEHNDLNGNFTLGINKFSDLTNKEYSDVYLGGFKAKDLWPKHCSEYISKSSNVPDSVDWTNILGPILDQGQCGSCYAFSSVQQIQSSYTIKNNKLIDLSEEQVVECSTKNQKCNGGLMDNVFKYAMTNPLCLEKDYPYISENGDTSSCDNSCEGVVSVTSCYDIQENNQIDLKNALYGQPISVAIDASNVLYIKPLMLFM